MARDYNNILPDSTRLSSGFDPERVHPVTGKIRPHKGIDIASPDGSPIYNPSDGVVIQVKNQGEKVGYGNYLVMQHELSDGSVVRTVYGHLLHLPTWSIGDKILIGEQIGEVGNTGASTGNHLHYEERKVAKGFENVIGDKWSQGTTPIDPARDMFALSGVPVPASDAININAGGHTGGAFTNPDIAYTSPADANSNQIPDILESQVKRDSYSYNMTLEQKVANIASQANFNGWNEQQKQQFYDLIAENANLAGMRIEEKLDNINSNIIT